MESSRSGISATINPELLEVKAGSKCDTRIKEEAYLTCCCPPPSQPLRFAITSRPLLPTVCCGLCRTSTSRSAAAAAAASALLSSAPCPCPQRCVDAAAAAAAFPTPSPPLRFAITSFQIHLMNTLYRVLLLNPSQYLQSDVGACPGHNRTAVDLHPCECLDCGYG